MQPSGKDNSPKARKRWEEGRKQGLVATGEPGGVLPPDLTQRALLHPCTCWVGGGGGSSVFYFLLKQQIEEEGEDEEETGDDLLGQM